MHWISVLPPTAPLPSFILKDLHHTFRHVACLARWVLHRIEVNRRGPCVDAQAMAPALAAEAVAPAPLVESKLLDLGRREARLDALKARKQCATNHLVAADATDRNRLVPRKLHHVRKIRGTKV